MAFGMATVDMGAVESWADFVILLISVLADELMVVILLQKER
jgi:hypothetical protein